MLLKATFLEADHFLLLCSVCPPPHAPPHTTTNKPESKSVLHYGAEDNDILQDCVQIRKNELQT